MKTILSLLFVLVLGLSVFAVNPPTISSGSTYQYNGVLVTKSTIDTITGGATDSLTLFSNQRFTDPGEYILLHPATTGLSADSVKLYIRADIKDANLNFMYSINVDSISTAVGYETVLPFGRTACPFGTIKLKAYTGAGHQTIVGKNWQIIRRRAIETYRSVNF